MKIGVNKPDVCGAQGVHHFPDVPDDLVIPDSLEKVHLGKLPVGAEFAFPIPAPVAKAKMQGDLRLAMVMFFEKVSFTVKRGSVVIFCDGSVLPVFDDPKKIGLEIHIARNNDQIVDQFGLIHPHV